MRRGKIRFVLFKQKLYALFVSKSVERLQKCGDLTVCFQNGGRPPSWICWAPIGTIHDDHSVVSIVVQTVRKNDNVKQRQTRRLGYQNEATVHTHPFNDHFSRTTRVCRYQKGKTNLDFTEARDTVFDLKQETVSGSGIR